MLRSACIARQSLRQTTRCFSSTSSLLDRKNVVTILQERGLYQSMTSSSLEELLLEGPPVTVYCGVDPSASSLHLGNLLPLMALLHFQLQGHNPIALVGGATGIIGDPTGRSKERPNMRKEVVAENVSSIHKQLVSLFDRGTAFAKSRMDEEAYDPNSPPIKIVNNMTWTNHVSIVDFLNGPGKLARMNEMLSKQSVKRRLKETGLSFTEFTYQLLQAFDFQHLNKKFNCNVQIGGHDQLGNIMAGVELIMKERNHLAALKGKQLIPDPLKGVYGLTVPLLTTSGGLKFGKSEGNALFFHRVYEIYQYLLKVSDDDCEAYLKTFTFLPLSKIEKTMAEHWEEPSQRVAQKLLAAEVIELLHGPKGLEQAKNATKIIHLTTPESLKDLKTDHVLNVLSDTHIIKLPKHLVLGETYVNALFRTGVSPGKANIRRAIVDGAMYINGNKCQFLHKIFEESDLIDGCMIFVKVGKNFKVIVLYEPNETEQFSASKVKQIGHTLLSNLYQKNT